MKNISKVTVKAYGPTGDKLDPYSARSKFLFFCFFVASDSSCTLPIHHKFLVIRIHGPFRFSIHQNLLFEKSLVLLNPRKQRLCPRLAEPVRCITVTGEFRREAHSGHCARIILAIHVVDTTVGRVVKGLWRESQFQDWFWLLLS